MLFHLLARVERKAVPERDHNFEESPYGLKFVGFGFAYIG